MRLTRLFFGALAVGATATLAFVGNEGCSSDTFSANDAATGDGGDAGPRFCASQTDATFCDDFDVEFDAASPFDPRWLSLVVGGTLTRSNDAVSAPGALVASVGPAAGPTTALLSYNANMGTARHLEIRAKVKIEPKCAGSLSGILTFTGSVGGIPVTAALITYPTSATGTTLALYTEAKFDGGKKQAAPGAVDVTLGSWTDVVFKLDFDAPQSDGGKGTNVLATYGGAPILDLKGAESAALSSPLMVIGTSADSPPGSCAIHYDDVVYFATQ